MEVISIFGQHRLISMFSLLAVYRLFTEIIHQNKEYSVSQYIETDVGNNHYVNIHLKIKYK